MSKDFSVSCPVPLSDYPTVVMAHGGGGRLTHQLIEHLFSPAFRNPALDQKHDGALLECESPHLAFTTDSYVVHPLFFPGGDIGTLAVNGTVNDLAMCGARARWLSCGLILEEGLPMDTLSRVVDSMRRAAEAAGVTIVTGDTKVVDHGRGHGLYVNTAGIGVRKPGRDIQPRRVQAGDAILLSGSLGRHGMAIMSVREGLEFESPIASDCAPLVEPVMALLDAEVEIHCLRDLTRGGLASALNEIATAAGLAMRIEEAAVPVDAAVRGACEILGLDPLYVANEGCFAAWLPPGEIPRAIQLLHQWPQTRQACLIGEVLAPADPPLVTLRTPIGAARILDLLSGEPLPRIC